MMTPSSPTDQKASAQDKDAWLGFAFAWELGYTIAIPALVLGVGGAYADKFLHTSPLFLLLGFASAFSLSALSITRKIREIIGRMPPDAKRTSAPPADPAVADASAQKSSLES